MSLEPLRTDEQTNVNNARSRRHVEHNILNGCSLRCRPVYTRTGCCSNDIRGIDDEIADLTVEDVRRDPIEVGSVVRVAID